MEESDGVLLAVAEAHCRYSSPARFDEEVIVRTWIEEANSRMVTFAYEMRLAEGGRKLATGETRHVFVGRDLKPCRMPAKYHAKVRAEIVNQRAIAAAGIASSAAFMAWAVRGRSSSVFGPSFWRGDPRRPAIALTFDDGPSEATPALLDILAREGAPATFFQCGANVERLPAHRPRRRRRRPRNRQPQPYPPVFSFPLRRVHGTRNWRARSAPSPTRPARRPRWMRAPYGVRWPGSRRRPANPGTHRRDVDRNRL